ncbi:TrkH family potassium uptake protein [Lutibaculum baratangense]|uniref:Trk system potassium uptake protein n=1 Tax=Lutibaculum baratangense AMV1 TaxID=631454 RepID=V4T9D7_9HYPH|nr:TrkH family potassium uptake protein [Lutibaculum baratangense]ESR23143.1 Potassium uptake protein TrkH [Lutibaculum baratangense AMV1]
MSIIFYVNGLLLAGLGVTMLVPALIDVVIGNEDWSIFAVSALVTWSLGTLIALAARRPVESALRMQTAFIVTTSVWISLSAFSALPFLGLGLNYHDAFFEAVSGFTTTGSTVLSDLELLPPGLLFWRALLQWIGGVGIVVTAIIVLPFLRVGGMQLFHTESSDRSEKIVPRPVQLVQFIGLTYISLTAACAALYKIGGMSFFDAICHAMTTLSTGGFANYDASFGHFEPPLLHWTATIFMLAGALPFVAYIKLVKGEQVSLWRDPQIRTFLQLIVVVSILLALWLVRTHDLPPLEALRLAAFNVVSITTTTGYASSDYTLWGAAAVGLFFLLTFIGGCSGSTTGAIKIYRFQILWRVLRAHLGRLARPNRLIPLRYSGQRIPEDVPPSVLLFLTTYFASVVVVTLLLAATGLDIVSALSGAATALGNVGPGLGEIIGPSGNFQEVPDSAKWILAFAMLLGRLELFTMLLLLDPEFWRR